MQHNNNNTTQDNTHNMAEEGNAINTTTWTEHSAPEGGRKFYYCEATGESTWER